MTDGSRKNTVQKTGSASKPIYGIISILTALALLLLINLIADMLERNLNIRLDVTGEKYSVLTDKSLQVVYGLENDIYLYFAGKSQQQDMLTTGLLQSYAASSPMVHYDVFDPGSSVFNRFGGNIKSGSVIISDSGSSAEPERFAVLRHEDLYTGYAPDYCNSIISSDDIYFTGEQKITSAIVYVTSGITKKAVFLEGQDEKKPCALLVSDLVELYYDVGYAEAEETLNTASDTLIIISPRRDLSQNGFANIETFLSGGGRAVFFMDNASVDGDTGEVDYPEDSLVYFKTLIAQYGVNVESNVVLCGDPLKTYKSPAGIIPFLTDEGKELLALNSSREPVLAYAGSITISEASEATVIPLLKTDDSCYAKSADKIPGILKNEPGDTSGSFITGAIMQKGDSEIVLYTSSSFVVSDNNYAYPGNMGLFLGTINFLNQRPGLSIPVKTMYAAEYSPYSMVSGSLFQRILLAFIVAGALPLAVLFYGVLRWARRKNM